ncbi:MAG: PEGA domain-containing protein, partial [candidate division Zixibacteria bacterium]|nr:PEGA domain-containing protein [candidate division Zixibacteria bacterium]
MDSNKKESSKPIKHVSQKANNANKSNINEPQTPDSPTPDESQQSDQFSVDWSSSPKTEKPTPPQNPNTPKKSDVPPSAKDFSKRRSEMDSNKKESSKPIKHVSQKANNANKSNINEPQTSDSKITKSARVRGIAHFHKNIIQLVGTPFLHENDEVVFKNKPYRLKPYRISKKVKLISMAAVFVLLSIVIGSQIIGPALPGEGQIVGVVLDGNGQPYLSGASIYIPELDKSVTSNAQGFFRFDDIPTGSYELIYSLEDDLEGRENITVTSGSLITRSFGDFRLIEDEIEYSANQAITEQNQPPPTPAKKNTTAKKTKKKKTSGKSKSSGYGKIKLAANIEGAKFVVDGKTLGAGNSTFTKIKSGKRKIQVSKSGYTEYTEIVTVSKNKTKTVKVNLSRKASDTEQPLTANEYFNLGNDAFDSKNYKLAISELNKAIELSPNHVDAYTKRAQSYVAIGENEKASSDYIRVGEIYKFKNQNGLSISQFTSALKYSKNNTTALAGRAGARMAKGEYRSALIDYTT